ncbi:MAG: DUF1194 domain-containing protein [Paracoccaceae bacterium]
MRGLTAARLVATSRRALLVATSGRALFVATPRRALFVATFGRALAIAALGGALVGLGATARAEPVDLELVLMADASGSIDDDEIAFQREGYAEAITDEAVLDAIATTGRGRIALAYVEWAGAGQQHVVVDWRVIAGAEDAEGFAAALVRPPRRARGRNAIGEALLFGRAMIEDNAYEGLRRVIDLSADSANNWHPPRIEDARDAVVGAGITINGLAVLCRVCSGPPVSYDLGAAFERRIAGGPGHFVVEADGAERFAVAVRRKLVLEIAGRAPDGTVAGRAPGGGVPAHDFDASFAEQASDTVSAGR